MRSAVIVEAKRTPIGRGVKGAYAATRPEQLGSVVIEAKYGELAVRALHKALIEEAVPEA